MHNWEPEGRWLCGRVLLLTFLGGTRKVSGCRAAPGQQTADQQQTQNQAQKQKKAGYNPPQKSSINS
ncbi:MAG: hypothetical protein HY253_08475 [Burkholderiales bacterium]|nr:hypothetical protein [Burkholderiales bacterium]